ncbi:MAG: response regulator transcription factor [Tissierellaceae bacterium]|nr:response regulator transcription factor [Tissierellaceae bacterium]
MDFKNILVVEDEKNISDVIEAYLLKEEFKVFKANDGEKALEYFQKEDIHLIILDLMIPKISGEEVCKRVRSTSDVPIIMLTAKTHEDDRIEGLTIGADDYVLKPFSPRELMSRVKALLRRAYPHTRPIAEKLSFNNGDLEIEIEQMAVKKNNVNVNITTNEFKVLLALVSNQNNVLSREQLIISAFGHEYEGFDRTIDTHIKNIRQKIESNPRDPRYIHTVYGTGYKFQIKDS